MSCDVTGINHIRLMIIEWESCIKGNGSVKDRTHKERVVVFGRPSHLSTFTAAFLFHIFSSLNTQETLRQTRFV